MPAAQAFGFKAQPAIALAASIFFDVELAILRFAEASQAGKLFLHTFEEVQNCLAVVRQGKLRAQPHVDVEILTERAKWIRHPMSPSKAQEKSPRAPRPISKHPQ